MERLNVITVPATDLDGNYHTAFTVYDDFSEDLRSSAGWTLRDAIEYYARKCYCDATLLPDALYHELSNLLFWKS